MYSGRSHCLKLLHNWLELFLSCSCVGVMITCQSLQCNQVACWISHTHSFKKHVFFIQSRVIGLLRHCGLITLWWELPFLYTFLNLIHAPVRLFMCKKGAVEFSLWRKKYTIRVNTPSKMNRNSSLSCVLSQYLRPGIPTSYETGYPCQMPCVQLTPLLWGFYSFISVETAHRINK